MTDTAISGLTAAGILTGTELVAIVQGGATKRTTASAIGALSGPVTQVAGRTGVITLSIADVAGAAPLASPIFTGGVTLGSWATAGRPASPTAGMVGYNTDLGRHDFFGAAGWTQHVRLGGDTFTGRVAVAPVVLTDAATTTLDGALGNFATWTMGGNRTLAVSNLVAGATYMVEIKQDATGSRTITWPASFRWPGATPGVLSTAPNSVDVLTFASFDGSTVRAVLNKGFA